MTSEQRILYSLPLAKAILKILCASSDPDLSVLPRDLSRQPLRCRRPNLPPPRTAIAAALLLVGGVVFLSLGLSVFYASLDLGGTAKAGGEPKDRGIALLVLGGISESYLSLSLHLHSFKTVYFNSFAVDIQ